MLSKHAKFLLMLGSSTVFVLVLVAIMFAVDKVSQQGSAQVVPTYCSDIGANCSITCANCPGFTPSAGQLREEFNSNSPIGLSNGARCVQTVRPNLDSCNNFGQACSKNGVVGYCDMIDFFTDHRLVCKPVGSGPTFNTSACTARDCLASDWVCSNWPIECTSTAQQARTCNLFNPYCGNPNAAKPATTRACVYIPPLCTTGDWSCGGWDVCLPSGQQTRSCNLTNQNCSNPDAFKPATSQACTYVAPACTANNWSCGSWSACSAAGQQTRTCTAPASTVCTNPEAVKPAESQSCAALRSCTSNDWTCGSWGICSDAGQQARFCTPPAGTLCSNPEAARPPESQSCLFLGRGCTDADYSCDQWDPCSNLTARQSRTCTLTGGVACDQYHPFSSKPVETQTCQTVACAPDDWDCNQWNICSASSQQTRTCTLKTTSNCDQFNSNTIIAPESQICTPAGTTPTPIAPTAPVSLPACIIDHWNCSEWSICSTLGHQTRTCDLKAGVSCDPSARPVEGRPCAAACKLADWDCADWGACSASGEQRRLCTPKVNCDESSADAVKPLATQSCTASGLGAEPIVPTAPATPSTRPSAVPAPLSAEVAPLSPEAALTLRQELQSLKDQFAGEQSGYEDKVRTLEARLAARGAENQQLVTEFPDVDKEPGWGNFTPFIARMRVLGVMKGDEKGNFVPQGKISKSELAVMLLRLVGVDTAAFGGWPQWQQRAAEEARRRAWTDLQEKDYNLPANRGEIMRMTLLALKLNVTESGGCFPDVPGNHPAGPYICTAKLRGIVSGNPDGTFKPGNPVSRAEMAKIIANASKEAVK